MILRKSFGIKEFSSHTAQLINEAVDHRGQPHPNLKANIACNVGSLFNEFQELIFACLEEIDSLKMPPEHDDEETLNNVFNKLDSLIASIKSNCNSLDKELARDIAMTWVSWVSALTKELQQISGLDRLADVLHEKIMTLPLDYK